MKTLFFYFLFLFSLPIFAQISQKDTTQTKKKKDSINYGVHTTRFLYEQDFLEKYKYRRPDTLLQNLHRYNYLQRADNQAQDLGSLGTPFQPIGYLMPQEIGYRIGTSVFEPYFYDVSKTKYFNTLSPFSQIYYVQGGAGRSLLDLDLSRNITPDWNVSIFFRRIEADKVFIKSVRENDTWTFNQTYAANTSYQGRRYSFLLNISHVEHKLNDLGGLQVPDSAKNLQFIDTVNNDAQLVYNLTGVTTYQTRLKARLVHQFSLDSGLQIYHSADWSLQRNRYTDSKWQEHKNYYPFFFFDTLKKIEPSAVLVSKKIENEIGVKGFLGKLFYRAYLKNRLLNLQREYLFYDSTQKTYIDSTFSQQFQTQWFVGGKVRMEIGENTVEANAEILKEGDYRFEANLQHRLLQASFQVSSYSPSMIERQWQSNFYSWDSSSVFKNTQAQQIRLQMPINLHFSSVSLQILPKMMLSNVNGLVYFDTLGLAKQSQLNLQVLQFGFQYAFHYNRWHALGEVLFSKNQEFDIIRLPSMQINSQFYYENKLFRRGILSQIGLDFHWKSAYYADTYTPATLQYNLQNRYKVENFPYLEVFFNVKVSKALFFAKMTNLFQDIVSKGYFVTPPHLSQPRSFELGIHWRFFD